MLYIFGGLPGTGKSTLSRYLARQRKAVHLRVDTIEQAIRNSGDDDLGAKGYLVAYEVAVDNLGLGVEVVADCVNPLQVTRDAWRMVADRAQVPFVEIEVICSDKEEHQRRVESRAGDIAGLRLPTWADVLNRQYDCWEGEHIVIDTAGQTPAQSIAALQLALQLP